MTPEQEIRAKALEISAAYKSKLAAACIIKGKPVAVSLYSDVETAVEYITNGNLPQEDL
jgi:hypothetical protein